MKDFQKRVVEEKKQNDQRLTKLREFIGGESFKELNSAERVRMEHQERLMTDLSNVLGERIRHFGE